MQIRIANLEKLRLAIRVCIPDGSLGLAFRDWQSECAYPMVACV